MKKYGRGFLTMAEYIERGALMQFPIRRNYYDRKNGNKHFINGIETVLEYAENLPAADVAPVVRCRDCINAEPLERNCEVNANFYMHCRLWRGEECKNVWHKYKRYYRDYSLVQQDDFCSSGERKDGAEC